MRIMKHTTSKRIYARTSQGRMLFTGKGTWEPVATLPRSGFFELKPEDYPVLYEGLRRSMIG